LSDSTHRRDKLNKNMDTLFPQSDSSSCRVCDEEVVDGRWNYCSERCREIAQAVQRKFTWSSVRDRVLERDDYTCQKCGLTKEMYHRAYWQIRELVDDASDGNEEWLNAWERYRSPPAAHEAFEVDHIERIADGGHALDETNLQTLCYHCHKEKTIEENSGRRGPKQEVTLEDYAES